MGAMAVPRSEDGGHIDSYYAATANATPQRSTLTGANDTDICIIGAGYSGLSAGLDLAEKGHKVTIIEGVRVGWGASGRNGGQIINGLNASLSTIKKRYGSETAKFVATNVQDGGEIIRQRIAKYDIDCDLKQGNVFAAITEKHMRELEARKNLWADYGIDNQEMLDREALKKYVNSEIYTGGLIDHSGGHMHPLNLALGEAAAFEKNGGEIYEMSPVTSVDTTSARPVVKTGQGQMSCRTLLICGNAYLGNVVRPLTSRVMPVSTQVLATEPLEETLARTLIPGQACIEDIRYILDYYRLSADNRLIFGGGSVYGGADPVNIEARLRRNLAKVFPQLANVKVDFAWSGNFALSFSRMPQIGRLGSNTYFAHGYSGHGVTASHLFGRMLSEAVDGDLSRFDVFAGIGWVPFPGGRKLAVPYSVLGSWWYGLRDRLGV